jgi:hypothetical protein
MPFNSFLDSLNEELFFSLVNNDADKESFSGFLDEFYAYASIFST